MQKIWETLMQSATEQELGDLCQHITDALDLRIHNYCSKSLRNQIRERKNYSESTELPKKSSRLWSSSEDPCKYLPDTRKKNCFLRNDVSSKKTGVQIEKRVLGPTFEDSGDSDYIVFIRIILSFNRMVHYLL